jgi:hypothetical protein
LIYLFLIVNARISKKYSPLLLLSKWIKKSLIEMLVIYDNNAHNKRLKTDWSVSCFIGGREKSILFDTGTNGQIL